MHTKSLDAPSRTPDEKASRPEASASGRLTNLFESLDIEEPSDTFLNFESSSEQPATSNPQSRYTVNQAPDLEEVHFAVHCLFNDLDNIRRYLQQVWTGCKQGAFDLVAASITTNTAIDFARCLEEDYIETFPSHTSFETHVNVLYMQVSYANGYDPGFKERPDDEMNFAIYREAETMLFPTYMLLSSFMDVIEPGSLPVYKPGHFGVHEPASERAPKSSRDRFREDKVVLLETLPDFCVFAQMPGSIPAEDELTRGVREMVKRKEVPIWLTFAAQVFLDIHHTLREQVGIGIHDLIKSASYAGNNIEGVLEFHNNLRIENWPRSNDRVLHQILDLITDWVKTDVVQDARIKLTRRSGFQPPPTESFQLLKRHPLYCGLLSYSIKALVQEASITFVNAWGSVVYSAHLYNALRQEKLISGTWQDMDLALLMHRTKDIFVGDFPRSIEDCAKRFSLAMGVSPTMMANNRRQAGLKVSKSGPRHLNDISPVSAMFKARYCGNECRTKLSPDDVDSILKKYIDGDGDDDSDSEWTTPKIEINVPEEPTPAPPNRERRTQKSRKRRRRTQPSARTGVAIGDDLREIFGPGYLTRKNQLPFIVEYLLYTAVQTKNLGGMLVSKKKDVVTSKLLLRAAAAMREMLEAGAGAIELKMLQTQF
ncbi:MAG: hypothetical protein M1835_003574 [Candelina submexicana]|nr:MAG: hypothetical protein M1835_003574 [Candelina submexicana]